MNHPPLRTANDRKTNNKKRIMIMKLHLKASILLLTTGLAVFVGKGNAQTPEQEIEVARSALKADHKATVAEAMQFTAEEGKAFWPLYEQYRAETGKLGDALVKLVKEYAQLYPDVPDDRARVMLKELGALHKQRVETKNSYLEKIQKVLSPAKTLRFAQVDSRLDLALQLPVAATIPLVPIEGRLTGEAGSAAGVTKGVPGGTVVQTYELKATVTAIDKAARKVTLMDATGIKTTVKAGPEVVNFDQIRVGDELNITAAQELVVSVTGEGETPSDSGAQMVALAPKGAKPGAIMAETMRVTAKVTAIDAGQHKATLQFEDGSTKTVAVRPDVDLSKRKVGDKVVIRITEALAIRVVKP
jgi:Cu/Ag efflux protein CusF